MADTATMSPLQDILYRNQGNVLTPELVTGIITANEYYAHGAVDTTIPTREAAPAEYKGPRLLVNDRERVGDWVAQRVGMQTSWTGGFGAIGQLDEDDEIVVGMVIDGLTATNGFMHVAISDRAKLHLGMVRACFDYVFNELDLERVTGHVDADNEAALRFDKHLGFEHEFTIPRGNGGDVHQLVLWRDRCRWIRPRS